MDVPQNQWTRRGDARVWYASAGNPYHLFRAIILSGYAKPSSVYLNSLFNPRFSILPLLLHRVGLWRGAQIVVAPRGEADPGALRLKSGKKGRYLWFARKVGLFDRVTWHASSSLEAGHIRNLGVEGTILVKENETLLPLEAHVSPQERSSTTHFLYVGRISPKKQLELLIQGLAQVSGRYVLHIVGEADDPAYERALRESAAPLGARVIWHGAADRASVFSHFDRCQAFCLPTAGENFGHVIAEALSRSCPVVVMDVTPWTEVIADGGGVIVKSDSVAAWSEVLEGILLDAENHAARRESAGRAYERWRVSVDQRSFLDYLLNGERDELQSGQ